jgi:hypothetical protein
MGTVYLARDLRLDRRIALKFIDPERFSSDDGDAQQRLLHEARAASGLNHPNICQVYDVGGEGRESWIAMEYVEGNRWRRSSARGLTPDASFTSVARLRTLDTASARYPPPRPKSEHRSRRRPKILDFGIARRCRR